MTPASGAAQHAQLACELLRIHGALLRDTARNHAFQRALAATVKPDSVVLDIGSGTGLWAITAARLGAKKVVAIEMEPLLAGLIRDLARDHGVSDKLEVIQGDSRKLQLAREFDLVVSETIGHVIFDEQIVEIMIDARERFLKPGGVLIPNAVTLMAAGASLEEAARLPDNFGRFESLMLHGPVPVLDKESLTILTTTAPLVQADMSCATAEPPLENLTARWPRQNLDRISCIAVWAEVQLTDKISLSTLDTSSWSATAYRIKPFARSQGDLEFRLTLSAQTNHWSAALVDGTEEEVQSYSPAIAAAEMLASCITLRPAEPADLPFLKRVYAGTRAEELAGAPWTAEEEAAFLELQFNAQDQDYHANYPDAAYDVIVRGDASLGRLYVHRRPDEISIIDIALLPEYRGAGIGGALLRELIAEADAVQKPLGIYVEKYNRAQALYRRLGFVETEDTGVYWRMIRPAKAR